MQNPTSEFQPIEEESGYPVLSKQAVELAQFFGLEVQGVMLHGDFQEDTPVSTREICDE